MIDEWITDINLSDAILDEIQVTEKMFYTHNLVLGW